MNNLTSLMQRYRGCLKLVWNDYFAERAGWDERDQFYDAAIYLFRGLVLYPLELEKLDLQPSYRRGDKKPILSIRVVVMGHPDIRCSQQGTFNAVKYVDQGIDFSTIDLRYVDLFDFYELGIREFAYVEAEVIAEPNSELVGERLLIPFDNVGFETLPDASEQFC